MKVFISRFKVNERIDEEKLLINFFFASLTFDFASLIFILLSQKLIL